MVLAYTVKRNPLLVILPNKFMKNVLLWLLALLSRAIIKRHNPMIIGITGSVGKTTVRHFLYEFLSSKKASVYSAEGNYNGEFWLPLSIMQARSWGRNLIWWIKAFFLGFKQIFRKDYPKILILEYGIDRIWEMDFMCDIVEPDIAIFTTLTENHIQNFWSMDAYVREKKQLARNTSNKDIYVITNNDDNYQENIQSSISFGYCEGSDLQIQKITQKITWISLRFHVSNQDHEINTKIFWAHNWSAIAPSILCLQKMWYSEELFDFFSEVSLPSGRWNTLKWMNDSIIIDATYNWSYLAIREWLRSLDDIKKNSNQRLQSIAIIWDMRELGPLEKSTHELLAKDCINRAIDILIFVGPMCQEYIQPLLPEAQYFLDSRCAGNHVAPLLNSSTILFAKGSQNTVFLEESLKIIINDSEKNKLIRQSEKWMHTKRKYWKSLT